MHREPLDAWIKVRVPGEVKAALKTLAGSRQRSVAEVVRQAFGQELEAFGLTPPQVKPAIERRKANRTAVVDNTSRLRMERAQLRRAAKLARNSKPAQQGHEFKASEYKLVCLREVPVPDDSCTFSRPIRARDYWLANIAWAPHFNGLVETLAVLLLDVRERIMGHCIAAVGTLTSVQTHPREVFRLAIAAGAASIVLVHNHPSGDPEPSIDDMAITARLVKAGRVIGIPVLDHLVIGRPAET